LGLAPGGVCLASDITATAGGLLHHRFTLTRRPVSRPQAIHLSVALAVGSPRPAVSRHRTLWSADFPQPGHCPAAITRPTWRMYPNIASGQRQESLLYPHQVNFSL